MNFEEYVKDEFKNGEKKFDKIETRLEIIHKQLTDIEIALKVDEKLRAAKMRNAGLLYGGIISIVVGVATHLIKGAF